MYALSPPPPPGIRTHDRTIGPSRAIPPSFQCLLIPSGLVNLVELDLSNNFLTAIPIAALSTLTNLKFLNLGANKIQVRAGGNDG